MCGIFGLFVRAGAELDAASLSSTVAELFRLSESRGKEAAGLAVLHGDEIRVHKTAMAATDMLRTAAYQGAIQSLAKGGGRVAGPLALIGHSRLVTNGLQGINDNNQPVLKDGLVGIHNGIVVNDAELWAAHPELSRRYEVDTEVLLALLARFRADTGSIPAAVQATFRKIQGSASVAVLFADAQQVLLATNTGSLYTCPALSGEAFLFSSERYILETLIRTAPLGSRFSLSGVEQLGPGQAVTLDLESMKTSAFPLAGALPSLPTAPVRPARRVVDESQEDNRWREALRRCTRCILPETMPFIEFDALGVCNWCRDHKSAPVLGMDALRAVADRYRRTDGRPDCIVAFSGGRDSSYMLHVVKRELGLNPVAYTYDWGMVTDLARRNQARICGKLGIEHVLVSADIKTKRRNIQKNVEAWLKRPDLGMIPLFMAGDKQYFWHADQLRKRMGIDLVFLGGNRYEKTNFKSGFCGVREGTGRLYDTTIANKARMAWHYGKNFLLNPGYLNTSLLDTAFAFFSSYLMRHDFVWLFNYLAWNEQVIERVLHEEYDWEVARDTSATWRIGDGTASFYNYIYYTVTGFSEHDTLLSNQIRDGLIARDVALERCRQNNRPRFESMRQYAVQIGFDFDEALSVINAMPRLFGRPAAARTALETGPA